MKKIIFLIIIALIAMPLILGCQKTRTDLREKPVGMAENTPALSQESITSSEGKCPNNFILIPGDVVHETEDFCVSKYEMKIKGKDDGAVEYKVEYQAESRASGRPWKNLNQVQAKEECEEQGHHLITNAEWMTIANNIETTAINWDDHNSHLTGETDSKLNIGHACRAGILGSDCRKIPDPKTGSGTPFSGEELPASSNDNEACYGYTGEDKPQCSLKEWNLHRRTHQLNNGEVIWDFAGNVWEWVDWQVPLAKDRARKDGKIDNEYLEINEAEPTTKMPEKSYKSKNRELLGDKMNHNRLGRYHPVEANGLGTAMRGGNYMHGEYNGGIYALGMGYAPDSDHIICQVGFRCATIPREN